MIWAKEILLILEIKLKIMKESNHLNYLEIIIGKKEKTEKKEKHEKTNDAIEILEKYLKIKGKDFYPDFTIYEDADELNIAYLETHIPDEINYIIDS